MPSGLAGQSNTGNTPELELTETGVVNTRRVITSTEQAVEVIGSMEYDARKLIARAARISAKLTGEPPYKAGTLRSQAKAWMSNFPVRFLDTVVSRIVPRLYMRLKAVPTLTMAKLPEDFPDAANKTEIARRIVTESIRGWKKWNFFIQGLFREPVIYGYGFAAWFDKTDWRPHVIRMDRGFVPFGTEVGIEDIAHFSVRWDYQPHELIDFIRDPAAAEEAGWIPEAVVRSVSKAAPPPAGNTWDELRMFDDIIRQSAAQLSWRKGVNLVQARHLFSREVSGKVSHRIIDIVSGEALYVHEDRFDSMSQVVCPYAFEYGDGTLQGSYGVGQRLYDLAVQYEKAFNKMIDAARAKARLTIMVPDPANLNQVRLTVTDEATFVTGREVTINSSANTQGSEEWQTLMNALRQGAEEIVGAYMPPMTSQKDVSAAAVNVATLRSDEIYYAVLDNLLSQFACMIQEMTRRLLSTETDDPVALECQRQLAKHLSPQEIAAFATAPAAYVAVDIANQDEEDASIINFLNSKIGDPQFNQRALKKLQSGRAVGQEITEQILLPEEDPTVLAEQSRGQMLENMALASGTQVPVSTRDNDEIHIKVLQPVMEQWLADGNVPVAELALVHMAAHYESGVQKMQIQEPDINGMKGYLADYEKRLNELKQAAQAAAQPQVPLDPSGVPPVAPEQQIPIQ